MADVQTKPLEERLFEAFDGAEPILDEATLGRLEADGVITHAESRILWGSLGANTGIVVED